MGRESQLGRVIASKWGSDTEITTISLRELSRLSLREFDFRMIQVARDSDAILWLGAILNFHAPEEEIRHINFSLPQRAATLLEKEAYLGVFLTFGSALENLKSSNQYLRWKAALQAESGSFYYEMLNWTHLRAHTLVGTDKPRPESFLGQLLSALKTSTNFQVHGSSQVRRFQDIYEFVDGVLPFVRGGQARLYAPILGPNSVVNLHHLATSSARLASPEIDITIDPSGAWSNDQTLLSMVKNDIVLAGGLDIPALVSKIDWWLKV